MRINPKILALLSALLFGAGTPLSKLLLADLRPVQLAGLLYLGSGLGLLVIRLAVTAVGRNRDREAKLRGPDIKWLIGAVACGGVLAPILLLTGLGMAPASTTSLLLNFEAVSTAVIAAIFFREQTGAKLWLAVALITAAGIVLSLDLTGKWGLTLGALGVLAACVLWGLDNNFTRNISLKDPFAIVIIKGTASGVFSLLLSIILGHRFPGLLTVIYSLALGAVTYGLSLFLFVLALRDLGSSRTGAMFGLAPFFGAAISLAVFREFGNWQFYVSLPLMALGAYFLLGEKHSHAHTHAETVHEHLHRHDDSHHAHGHEGGEPPAGTSHSHPHRHGATTHAHEHSPDIHHRHAH